MSIIPLIEFSVTYDNGEGAVCHVGQEGENPALTLVKFLWLSGLEVDALVDPTSKLEVIVNNCPYVLDADSKKLFLEFVEEVELAVDEITGDDDPDFGSDDDEFDLTALP